MFHFLFLGIEISKRYVHFDIDLIQKKNQDCLSQVTNLRKAALSLAKTRMPFRTEIKIQDQTYGLDYRGCFTAFDTAPLLSYGLTIVSDHETH